LPSCFLAVLVPYKAKMTTHLKKLGKVRDRIPEWSEKSQENVRGNCFRPTPLGKIGGTNFFLLALLAYYLYPPLFNWWCHPWLKSIAWSSWRSTSESPRCIIESLPYLTGKVEILCALESGHSRSRYWMIA